MAPLRPSKQTFVAKAAGVLQYKGRGPEFDVVAVVVGDATRESISRQVVEAALEQAFERMCATT